MVDNNTDEEKLITNTSRRSFLKTSALIGLGASVLPVMPASAKPKSGGTLRLGLGDGATSDTFESSVWTGSWMINLGRAVFNQLVQVDNNGKLIPELATSWSANKKSTSWTINLRKGIQFHNGKEFTADDVLYSLNKHFSKESKSGAKGLMSAWKKIVKVSKYQIRIDLSRPDLDLPWVLNDYHLVMIPKGFTDWLKPIGTGAFVFKKYTQGVSCYMVKNKNYWKKGAGHFNAVEFRLILDENARMNALLSGQVDAIGSLNTKLAPRIEKISRFKLVKSITGEHYVNNMNTSSGILKDNNIRLAIKYATNRELMVKTILNNYGSIGNDNPISPSNEYFNTELKQREHDYDKAKYYFKKSGIGNSQIELFTSDGAYSGAVDQAMILQQDLRKAGANLKVNRQPADGYWSNVWMKKDFVSSYWGPRPTAAMTFATAYKTGASWNDTRFSHAKFDKLLLELQTNPNKKTQKAIAWEMQEILANQGGQHVPMFSTTLDAAIFKVKGLESHGTYGLNDYRLAEKGWFA